jgi:hypothetical protein
MVVVGRGGIPATGVGAVALDVTVTEPSAASYLTVWPTGAARPLASNLHFSAGQTVANSVLTKVGANGSISIFNNAGAAHVVVDVLGWFPDNQSYVGLTPAARRHTQPSHRRWAGLEHRPDPGDRRRRHHRRRTWRGAANGVGAVALNVTATDPTSASFITVWPSGAARPTASSLNVVAGQTVPNMVIAKVGANGRSPCTTTRAASMWSSTCSAGSRRHHLQRNGPGAPTGHPVDLAHRRWRDNRRSDRRAAWRATGGATAVALNVTVTQPAGASFLTVWPGRCAAVVVEPQLRRRRDGAQHGDRETRDRRKISLFTQAPSAHVVIDVLGWFSGTGSFTGVVPAVDGHPRWWHRLGLTPGTSWQWQIDGNTIDQTVLDGVANPRRCTTSTCSRRLPRRSSNCTPRASTSSAT